MLHVLYVYIIYTQRTSFVLHSPCCFTFWSFEIIDFNAFAVEGWIPLKLVLGGVSGVAHFSIAHEQTQLNRVCNFQFLLCCRCFQRISPYSDLIYFTTAGVKCLCGGGKTSPRTLFSVLLYFDTNLFQRFTVDDGWMSWVLRHRDTE